MRLDVKVKIERIKKMEIKVNKSEIARQLNCDVRTVGRYLKDEVKKKPRKKKVSKLDKYKGIIIEKVDNYSATAKSVYEFIKERGYEGGYGIVKKYVREHKSQQKKKATMRFETLPGYQAQVDWKENLQMVSKSGKKYKINIFLYVLGYSRYKYIEMTFDRKQETLFKCMNNAFNYTKGIPKEILFDNMRTVANITPEGITVNKKFEQFSKDYYFIPSLCRPYRPQTKGKVEIVAKLMSRLAPYNNEFESEQDLINIIKSLNLKLNNEICQAFNDTPINKFNKEIEYLNPLPNLSIRKHYTSISQEYKVGKDSTVSFKGNKYSIPIDFINKKVSLEVKDNFLHIYYNTILIESHVISESILNYKKDTLKDILKSDSLKHFSDDSIDDFISNNLKSMDILID